MQSNNGDAHIPIKESDLTTHRAKASSTVTKVSFRPKPKPLPSNPAERTGFRESAVTTTVEDTQSLLAIAKTFSNDQFLLSDAANHVITTVRDGLCIGTHLAHEYKRASGLETLSQLNGMDRLPDTQKTEFQAKNSAAAAIAAFACASYIVWKLSAYEPDKVEAVKMPDAGEPEINLVNYIKALEYNIYGLCLHIKSGLVQNDIQMVRATVLYFESVMRALELRQKSFGYTEFFTEVSYRLENSEFRVRGFEEQSSGIIITNEFNRIEFEDIVGNRLAKHAARRTAQRLACYDPEAKKNPFSVIGGLPLVRMGFGFPGTGKSLQIAATATLIERYCQMIGVKFVFSPMPTTVVSSYQGESAGRMATWMRLLHNTDSVNYMPIDDAEDNFCSRSQEKVSEGTRKVISVFLTETEGASAPKNGNSVLELFTNLPEQIDAAVLSRVSSRFTVDGAVTFEDFLDQDHLWLRPLGNDKDVRMEDPKGYEYLATQKEVANVGALQLKVGEVTDERLREALTEADHKYDRKNHGFYAALYVAVQKRYPLFRSRDIRNIQQAINSRITDFDIPESWFEQPDQFFRKPFEEKVDMLKELRKECMKGLSFAEIRLEETLRYLSTLANIANVERERKVVALLESLEVQRIAGDRWKVIRSEQPTLKS